MSVCGERLRRVLSRLPDNAYRDVWLVVVTGLVVLALANQQSTTAQVSRNQRSTTNALCSLKNDLQKRVDTSLAFLQAHPHGIPGISAATISEVLAKIPTQRQAA